MFIGRLRDGYRRLIPNKHLRHGLPFLTFLSFGLLGIKEFAQIRYDFKKKLGWGSEFQEYMEERGLEKGEQTTEEEEYEKLVKNKDLDAWFNIRGPRPGEDSRTIQNKLREEHAAKLEKSTTATG